ncbi:MAG: phosphate ABC transporter substrate-binding protein [Spirochaetes bacterium]|nr:phosphate ABC transporter substrate-binding protein [Spirochaetota bacterium]
MKKSFYVLPIALLSLLVAAGAVFAGSKEVEGDGKFAGDYAMGGSTTVEPIVVSAIEAFAKKYPAAKISYDAQGSSVGVTGVVDGVYVLGGSSRELKDKEIDAGVVPTAIALDGIAVVVNDNVPIDNLSLEQVARIFAGEIRNWKEVSGPDREIVVVNRDEASGTRAAFSELVLEKNFGKGKAKFIADAITTESNGDMVTKVGQTPDTIGYCGFGYIDKAKNIGGKTISVDGSDPTVANVLTKEYPVSRYLYVVSKGQIEPGSLNEAFVSFLLSDEGQQIVEETGYIAIK